MGKKNIQPTTSSPVSRTLVVAPRPALEELRAEPQEGHISSLTGPDPSMDNQGGQDPAKCGPIKDPSTNAINNTIGWWYTSYDGDDE